MTKSSVFILHTYHGYLSVTTHSKGGKIETSTLTVNMISKKKKKKKQAFINKITIFYHKNSPEYPWLYLRGYTRLSP